MPAVYEDEKECKACASVEMPTASAVPLKGQEAAATCACQHLQCSTANDQVSQPCHLLALSPELRNQIYYLALVEPTPLHLNNPSPTEKPGGDRHYSPTAVQPSLLRTCRQIRSESLPVFYGNNAFQIYGGYLLIARWWKALSERDQGFIKDIRRITESGPWNSEEPAVLAANRLETMLEDAGAVIHRGVLRASFWKDSRVEEKQTGAPKSRMWANADGHVIEERMD